MITNVSLLTLYVTDQEEAKAFYLDNLGFVEHTDVTTADGLRWCTIAHPNCLELEVALIVPGANLGGELAAGIRRGLTAGLMTGFGIRTDDCHADYRLLSAKGVEFVQPPTDRPYGIEAVLWDNSGNQLVMEVTEP